MYRIQRDKIKNLNFLKLIDKPIQLTALNGTKHLRMDQVRFSKGCLPQIFLGPFLNTLSQMKYSVSGMENAVLQVFATFSKCYKESNENKTNFKG